MKRPNPLAIEVRTWRRIHAALAPSHPGAFVLIKGSDLLGVFDTQLEAIREGRRRLGNVPFLTAPIDRGTSDNVGA